MAPSPSPEPAKRSRRPRLLWTLLGAMALVALLPLVISHLFLIDINRESLETLEKKYLSRSAVGIAAELQNVHESKREQMSRIAGQIRVTKQSLPPGGDPFTYPPQTKLIAEYITDEGD